MALTKAFSELFLHHKYTVIHLNLEIPGHSDECMKMVENFCKENSIELLIYYLKKYKGYPIYYFRNLKTSKRICGIYGIIKRYLMNKITYENDFDYISTGRNLDDVVEILFNLYLNGSIEKLVPVTSSMNPRIARKIKLLIEITDLEDSYYVISKNLDHASSEYLLIKESKMVKGKKLISSIEEKIPNFKYTLLKSRLKHFLLLLEEHILPLILRGCEVCGMPSAGLICNFCKSPLRIIGLVENG